MSSLEKENLRFMRKTEGDNRMFFSKNGDEVIQVTTDTDISSTLIFEISSVSDHLIFELRSVPQNEIIAFTT